MKKLIATVIAFLMCCMFGIVAKTQENDCLRLHIRANSNSAMDQRIKEGVAEEIDVYIRDNFGVIDSSTDLSALVDGIGNKANEVLSESGIGYFATCTLKRENFEDRQYKGISVKGGEYDSIIVEIGEGKGDNWWCLLSPSLYLGGEVYYKSRIIEAIESFRKGVK